MPWSDRDRPLNEAPHPIPRKSHENLIAAIKAGDALFTQASNFRPINDGCARFAFHRIATKPLPFPPLFSHGTITM
jgi:hypothetical protein